MVFGIIFFDIGIRQIKAIKYLQNNTPMGLRFSRTMRMVQKELPHKKTAPSMAATGSISIDFEPSFHGGLVISVELSVVDVLFLKPFNHTCSNQGDKELMMPCNIITFAFSKCWPVHNISQGSVMLDKIKVYSGKIIKFCSKIP